MVIDGSGFVTSNMGYAYGREYGRGDKYSLFGERKAAISEYEVYEFEYKSTPPNPWY
jgi:hypothetical protein